MVILFKMLNDLFCITFPISMFKAYIVKKCKSIIVCKIMPLVWFSVVLQDYLPYSLNSFVISCFIKKNIEFYLVLAIFLPKRVGANEQRRMLLKLELLSCV